MQLALGCHFWHIRFLCCSWQISAGSWVYGFLPKACAIYTLSDALACRIICLRSVQLDRKRKSLKGQLLEATVTGVGWGVHFLAPLKVHAGIWVVEEAFPLLHTVTTQDGSQPSRHSEHRGCSRGKLRGPNNARSDWGSAGNDSRVSPGSRWGCSLDKPS